MFIDERLLDCVSYGTEFSHGFKTRVVTLKSGVDRRNADWSAPLKRFSVIYNNLKSSDHVLVRDAHLACMGQLHEFRFKDWTDYTATDEEIGTGTGAAQQLQLTKAYSFGATSYTRNIVKPVQDTVIVSANGTPISSTCDYATGIVTFTATIGHTITWSGEFDVPVRFDDDELSSEPVSKQSTGLFILSADVGLSEVRL